MFEILYVLYILFLRYSKIYGAINNKQTIVNKQQIECQLQTVITKRTTLKLKLKLIMIS